MTVELDELGPVVTVRLSGDVDMATVSTLAGVVTGRLDRGGIDMMIIDLSDVSFIDTTGLNLLVECSQWATQRSVELALRGLSPQTRKLFEITSLTDMFRLV